MKNHIHEVIQGQLLDEDVFFRLDELCELSDVPPQFVMELVSYGVLEPKGKEQTVWRFSGPAVTRVKTVLRLQRDLEVNLPGAAVIVELLEELEHLRR
ncbi:MAG: MerR family transcriptional regulator [Gammaproteobacteria bacterium]|nr:MerR family transcriptional regulator [Gammaproteobacteria bacterium]